jgi:hypothetical protein
VARDDNYVFEGTPGQRLVQVLNVLANDSTQGFARISQTTSSPGNRGRITVTAQRKTLRYVFPRYVNGRFKDVFT